MVPIEQCDALLWRLMRRRPCWRVGGPVGWAWARARVWEIFKDEGRAASVRNCQLHTRATMMMRKCARLGRY